MIWSASIPSVFLQGKDVSNTILGKVYKISWLKMHFYAVSKTPLPFYCSSDINSTASTLWNAIYRRNKWSCSPVLGFAGSRWAVLYTWQLCTEKQEEKMLFAMIVGFAWPRGTSKSDWWDLSGWSELKNQGDSNKLSFSAASVIQWAVPRYYCWNGHSRGSGSCSLCWECGLGDIPGMV